MSIEYRPAYGGDDEAPAQARLASFCKVASRPLNPRDVPVDAVVGRAPGHSLLLTGAHQGGRGSPSARAIWTRRARTAQGRPHEPQMRGGVYYCSSHKGRCERVPIAAPVLASVGAVLADLREVIASGHFTRTGDEDDCRYCEFVVGCGGRANAHA
jgi:hypothetical protein